MADLPVDDEACFRTPLIGGGWLECVRGSRTASFYLAEHWELEELAHPLLTSAAGVVCRWDGAAVLHGGVITAGESAVAIVGDREAGKSTLLAWLHLQRDGVHVLSDDLVVVRDGQVFAGPRCIDLRPSSAEALVLPPDAALSRHGTRVRLPTAAGPPHVRLGAVVLLRWGSEVSLTPVPAVARLPLLAEHTSFRHSQSSARDLLALCAFPLFVLTRPRDWARMAEVSELLRQL